MMTDYIPSTSYLVEQITKQRRNFVAVCRSSIKSIIDEASYHPIDGNSPAVLNFCAIIEHILSHRLRPHRRWYGSDELRWFWDYIKVACSRVPHSCFSSIEAMENPKTPRGKGRAWIRMALMEKRLSEYLSAAIQQTKTTRSCYLDGSIMLTEDSQTIVGMVIGLNAIDISFDIKSPNLDYIILPVIDYSPFMKYVQIDDDTPNLPVVDNEGNVDNIQSEFWKQKYTQLVSQNKVSTEQKGYLEELVRVREGQLDELQGQRQKVIETLHHFEAESRRERKQLENVIIELQAQIMELKDINKVYSTKILILERDHLLNNPVIAMSELAHLDDESFTQDVQLSLQRSGDASCELQVPTLSAYTGPTPHPDAHQHSADKTGGSTVMHATAKEDTQSMIVLAGSYTSEAGMSSTDNAQIFSQALASPLKMSTRSPQNICSPKRHEPRATGQQVESSTSDTLAAKKLVIPGADAQSKDHDRGQPKPDLVVACGDPRSGSHQEPTDTSGATSQAAGGGKNLSAPRPPTGREVDDTNTGEHPIARSMLQSIIIEGEAEESDS